MRSEPLRWLLERKGEVMSMAGVVGSPLVGLLAGVVTVRHLTPEQVGALNIAALWPAYLGFLHFGTLTGMARQLPLSIGAGDEKNARHILGITTSIVWRTSALGALTCLFLSWYLGWRNHDELLGLALMVGAITVLSNNYVLQVDTALRSYGRFQRYGVNQMLSNLVGLLSLPLVVVQGALGAVGRLAIVGVAAIVTRSGTGFLQSSEKLNWREIRQLCSVGFPLLISGMFFTYLMMADRSIVALMLSRAEIGYFSLSAIIVNSLQFLPQALSMIVFPKMARVYGASHDPRALRPYVLKTLWLNLLTLLPISLGAYALLPYAIQNYFPAYVAGIRAGQIACLTSVFWVYLGMGSVFGVMNRMRAYLTVLAVSIGLVWGGGYVLISRGYGIEGAALARLLATMLICAFTIWYSLRLTGQAGVTTKATANA